MGCATSMVKYLMFLANLIFALAGLALIIIGVMYKVNSGGTDMLPSNFGIAPTLSIIIGCVVFVTAFLGCCGAVKESTCMLTTYAVILLTIFIIQIAIAVYAFLQIKDEHQLQQTVKAAVQRTFDQYNTNEEAHESFDLLQSSFHCCGVKGPSDWTSHTTRIPSSCCPNKEENCSSVSVHYYTDGCSEKLNSFLHKSINVVGYVAIGVAAVEIIGAVFALCLASSIRNSYRRGMYA